jgi:predicted MFS family arabinose efflux permease
MGLLFVSGFCLVCAFSTLNSLVQENAPEAFRGRVVSIFGLAFRGGTPVGSLVAGLLVKRIGAPTTLGAFSALLVLVSLAVSLRSARIREL